MRGISIDRDNPERVVGTALAEQTLREARGHHQEFCVAEDPKRAYYVSNLTPPEDDTGDGPISEFTPNAIGLDFRPVGDECPVTLRFEVYYQTHPTYDEYEALIDPENRDINATLSRPPDVDEDTTSADSSDTGSGTDATTATDANTAVEGVGESGSETDTDGDADVPTPDDAYGFDVPFYRRVDVTVSGTVRRDALRQDAAALTRQLQNELAAQLQTAARKTPPTTETLDPSEYDIDLSDLDEEAFESIAGQLRTHDPDDLMWPLEFSAEAVDGEVRLRLQLHSFGDRAEIPGAGEDNLTVLWDPDADTREPAEECVFNPVIETAATVEPYELDLTPDDYQFDQRVWAKGHNCSTTTAYTGGDGGDGDGVGVDDTPTDDEMESGADERTASSSQESGPPPTQETAAFELATTAVPTASVMEFDYRTTHDTRFLTLAEQTGAGTIDALEAIADGMEQYHTKWLSERKEAFAQTHAQQEVDAFVSNAESFEEVELARFRAGIDLLREDNQARRAFRLMNRVNHRVHMELTPDGEGFDGWRLFQIVFIVSNLPDIVARDPDPDRDRFQTEFADVADVLWFPTGGGKTEAYLGIILFTLFFDRLRGKDRGVSAWIRFPLRLLSSQQKSRFLKSLLVAEEFRQRTPDDESDDVAAPGLDGDGEEFSLGFFVGSQDTPNSIDSNQKTLFEERDEALVQACQTVFECPLCGSTVEVRFDETRHLVEHHCTGEGCIGRLPLYVVDHDIYRYLPSVLLGSLDKVSVMGFQPRFANLFGNFTTQCDVHGLGYSGNCPEKGICGEEDSLSDVSPGTRADREATFFDPIPSLHLVDEVHLLNEELGTFAGHYETAYLELCKLASAWQAGGDPDTDGVTPKVLTSTATISKYARQMNNLFQKDAVRFPQEGPDLRETYYGKLHKSDVEREYGGITPNNRTHLYAILDFVKRYHETIRDYHDADPDEVVADVLETQRAVAGGGPTTTSPDTDTGDDAVQAADRESGVAHGETDQKDGSGSSSEAEPSWAAEFDAETKTAVLDKYETSLVYFTNKREKDTFRNNVGKQIADEMQTEGYDRELKTEQLTADTQGTGVLDTLLHPPNEFASRPDTIPCTSFVGHGIDNPRFNFMIFFGYPSQTFQYIQASSRVGRQSGTPGFIIDFFRPHDLRDRHRYKYFPTLHQHLSRTVQPVAIDRWAKFGAEQTHPGIIKSILLQHYRPKCYWHRTNGELTTIENDQGEGERLNVQKASHFYQVMHDEERFPEVTKENLVVLVNRLYGVGDATQPIGYIRQLLDEETRRIWDIWTNELNQTMTTPKFPEDEGPMRNLRDIGDSGKVSAFGDTSDFIDALVGGEY